jgi:DNA-binding transcriptional MerR regulator
MSDGRPIAVNTAAGVSSSQCGSEMSGTRASIEGAMSKSIEAFRTISEVADELDVHKHVLRFWESKFPQIKPMKRGGGRRYYRPEDMILLRGIRHLLQAEGYTIKGVQKILREQGIDQVKAFADKAAKLEASQGKGKRGRPARLKDGETAGEGPAPRSASAASKRPPTRDDIINQLISELEACRALLGAKLAPVVKSTRRVPEGSQSRGAASGGRAS